jgi:hypothetical protein
MNLGAFDGWSIDRDAFIFLVAAMVAIGVIKDIWMFGRWFDRRMQPRSKPRPEGLVTNERFDERTEEIVEEIKNVNDVKLQSLLKETQSTNDLLRKFLLAMKILTKSQLGIDLDL